MSRAAKTGFPPYIGPNGIVLHAAKITGMVTDQVTGCTVISFGELDKQIVAEAKWVGDQQPNVGGYMVVTNVGDLRTQGHFMHAQQFEGSHSLDVATIERLKTESSARTALVVERMQIQLAEQSEAAEAVRVASIAAGEKDHS